MGSERSCGKPFFIFFFFQAEDGIRDYKVTGVQTCALPISFRVDRGAKQRQALRSIPACLSCREIVAGNHTPFLTNLTNSRTCTSEAGSQIGRASCRERV